MKEINVSSISQYVEYIEKITQSGELWFRGVAKRSYLPVPGIIWRNATEHEGSLEHKFLVGYKAYIENNNFSSWEVLALMQHHGLPTRLLDWSESALVALYFALANEPSSNGYRAVWVMSPYSLNKVTLGEETIYCPAILENKNFTVNDSPFNLDSYLGPNLRPVDSFQIPTKPIAINCTQHLKRVSSQKGCFTIHGSLQESINTYLPNESDFHMIRIDARSKEARKKMLDTLAIMGIDEEFIYQDLDSLCRRIKRENSM